MRNPESTLTPHTHIWVRTDESARVPGEGVVVQAAGSRLLIRWPAIGGRRLAIEPHQMLTLFFTEDGREFATHAEVLETHRAPEALLTILLSGDPVQVQRRDHFRVSAFGRAELDAKVIGLAQYKDAGAEARKIPAEVYNISAGGCSIRVRTSVPVNAMFDVKVFLQGERDNPIAVSARVVRCRALDDASFQVGLVFCNVSEAIRGRIMRFVFDAQREQMSEE